FAADQFVIFDIETTGLSPTNNRITEIGGVIVQGGEVVGTFSTFADPGCPIPANITEITGITDDMVAGAPSQGDAVRAFLDFAGGRTLVAHNANFDMGFIRHVCTTNAIPLENSYVDTVAISRYINPDLRRHRLDVLCEHYGVKNAGHHRAVNDCEALAEIFAKMTAKLAEEGVQNIAQLNEAMANRANPKQLSTNHAVIFAKNRAGLKKLYELVSQSHLDYYYRSPRIPKSLLSDCRDDLLLGSACEAGELYQAILDNKPHSELQEIAAYYDYLEIHPLANNAFLVANGKVANQEELQEHNRLICRLGEETGRPVVAVTDAHYLRAEDDIYRKILLSGMKFSGAGDDHELYLRTTEEMLAEFAYLGEEKAYEVVVENTNTIADSIEQLRPIPKGTYTASLEGADAELMELCRTKALATYSMDGETLPEEVSSRLSRELDNIIKHGFGTLYLSAQKLVEYSEKHGYLVGSRGSVGSSFAATMSGISEVNPLPPHYRCPACRYSNFSEKTWEGGSYAGSRIMNGLDLPNADCPKCGGALVGDGHDIPFETFMGFNCDKTPDIDLNFSGEIQGQVHKYTEELFGSANVFRAGTIGTLASKTAYGFVKKFLDDRGVNVNRAEINRLVSGCVGTKRTTGQHPGGMMVVPGDMSIHDFSPVQRPADDVGSDVKTTHFAFTYLHDTILKLDILGHDIPTKYKRMEEYTGVAIADVPMNDPEVYKLLTSTQPLGLKEGATSQNVGTLGLPELGTSFVMQMLEDARPQNFADLVQISGLSHGTDVWIGNAAGLIRDGTCTISEVIGTRDDIMLTLIRYGLPADNAFAIMESVRKGKGLKPEWEEEMRSCGVPEWYMESCRKIKYMFPKAHAAAYVMSAVRLGWYKIYHPTQFYAAYFSVDSGGFDATIVAGGRGRVKAEIAMTNTKIGEKKHTAKDKETLDCMLLVEESMARGIKFLPPCLQKSQATAFLVEDGAVRMPLQALPGLGENVAKSIVTEREKEPFANQLELQKRAGINKTVMEVLAAAGMLEGMAETNQITMF
ncbi:MAG: PolC-type DNA polymerase III, partial [Oscillospiraceae bacterium]|nr:PolC-type DNA polymerase III [Oscillospiraceae bacterium]